MTTQPSNAAGRRFAPGAVCNGRRVHEFPGLYEDNDKMVHGTFGG